MHLLDFFDKFSLRPENAKELKGLILDLAIRGRLTEEWRKENHEVESASVLLERIKEEKARLIQEKKIRKEKSLPKIVEEDISYIIPNTWVNVRLGEIGDWGAGATPKRSRPEFYGGEINWFKSGELNNKVIDFDSKERITDLAVKESSVRLNQPGDILIAMYGATIGKTARLEVVGTTNQAVCACTCFKGMDNKFLHLLLKALKQIFTGQGEGGAQPNISRIKIRNQVFGLPPLPEQQAIVAIVNQLMAEVDELQAQTTERAQLRRNYVQSALRRLTTEDSEAAWQHLQPQVPDFFDTVESIDKLKEAILQLAVQGKLTRQWREENPITLSPSGGAGGTTAGIEPASVLLQRIQAEKARLIKEKKIRKEKPLPEITEEEIPFELPEGWEWCRMGQFTTIKGGKRLPKGEKLTRSDTGRVYIRVTDMKNGTIDDSDLHYITEDVFEKIGKYLITKDDIYLTIVGATIGKLGLVPERFHRMNLTENAARIIIYSVDKYFLYRLMTSKEIQSQFFDKTNQVGVPKLALHRVAKTLIPLPPLPEQQAIVAIVNQLMAHCDEMKAEIERRNALSKDFLRSSIREVMEQPESLA